MKWTILIILIAYFVAMFIIGLIANRKSKTVTDYYVAGRGLGGVITALVYMSSLVSAGAPVPWWAGPVRPPATAYGSSLRDVPLPSPPTSAGGCFPARSCAFPKSWIC